MIFIYSLFIELTTVLHYDILRAEICGNSDNLHLL